MENMLAIVVGAFFAVSVYLMMSRYIIRIMLGVAVLSNAVNLLIFTSGRLTREVPPSFPWMPWCQPRQPPILCRRP